MQPSSPSPSPPVTMQIISQILTLSALASIVLAAPMKMLSGRALPTPISAATARTYLAARAPSVSIYFKQAP